MKYTETSYNAMGIKSFSRSMKDELAERLDKFANDMIRQARLRGNLEGVPARSKHGWMIEFRKWSEQQK